MNLNGLREVFSDALPIIEKFAPTLAGAIGGPFGAGIGYVIPLLATVFSDNNFDLKRIADTILADPLAPDKLGALEHEHSDILCTMIDSIHNLQSAEIHVKLEWNEMK